MTWPIGTSPRPTAISSPAAVGQRQRAARPGPARASSGGSSRRRRTSRARISLPSAQADRLLFVLDPLLDLVPRARGAHVAQPVPAGLGRGLVRISTVSPLLSSRCSGAIRPLILAPWQWSPTSVWTWKAKSIGRGALGQPLHVALGREDEDLVLVEVDLQELEELLRAVGVLLQLQQLAEPAEVLVELVGLPVPLVDPVGRDAVLGGAVHLLACGSGPRTAGRPDRRWWCGATGRRSTSGWRCSP